MTRMAGPPESQNLACRMSPVRRKHPQANVLAIRHLSDHFGRLQYSIDPNQPVFDFAKGPGLTLDALHARSIDTNFQVTAPRATIGEDPVAELGDVYELFVAEPSAPDVAERAALAPSRFRKLVATRLRQSGFVDGNRLQA